MKAEILDAIPTSGSVEQIQFDASGDCLWVRFEDSECNDWVGVFGLGFTGVDKVVCTDSGTVLVLANGQGYFLDIDSRRLISRTLCDNLKTVMIGERAGMFAMADDVSIYLHTEAEELFHTDRIALDGVEFREFHNHLLSGRVWNLDGWHDFTLNVETQEYVCDWTYDLG